MKQLYAMYEITHKDIQEGIVFYPKDSHYTVRAASYISFFKKFLDWSKMPISYKEVSREANSLQYLLDRNMFEGIDKFSGEIIELSSHFDSTMNIIAPDGMWFGAHPISGNVGFWKDSDALVPKGWTE